MSRPLCIDLFAGLGGWSEAFMEEGYDVIGFDIERHQYPLDEARTLQYPGQLVLQDVRTIHGSQFRNAAVIVASPPCQKYSWLAMPWSRSKSEHSQAAKALRKKWETEGPDNELFNACFRIQREAIEASSCDRCSGSGYCGPSRAQCMLCFGSGKRYIPLIVENVRGAQPWVGNAKWSYGSFFLWGDVPALMPMISRRVTKNGNRGGWFAIGNAKEKHNPDGRGYTSNLTPLGNGIVIDDSTKTSGGSWFRERNGVPQPGIPHEERGLKTEAHVNKRDGHGHTRHLTNPAEHDAVKIGGDWLSDPNSTCRKHGSRSKARKAASAQIAKIPMPLAQHIARVYKPREDR